MTACADDPRLLTEQWETLVQFCADWKHGYTLVADDSPGTRPDAVGLAGATDHAQLCAGRVIAAVRSLDSLHSIAHEIGHGEAAAQHGDSASFDDERGVTVKQILFLCHLAQHLLGRPAPAAGGDPREVSPAELRDLRERIERHRATEPRKLYAGQTTAAWAAWNAAGEVVERIAALLAHIDALTDQAAELRARAERAEAECVRANIAHHEALVDRDKLFDEALVIRQERDQVRHEARLARRDADHHRAMRERLESFPLQRCYDALARRDNAIRAAATRIAANPTAEGARELAALVLGDEPGPG